MWTRVVALRGVYKSNPAIVLSRHAQKCTFGHKPVAQRPMETTW